MKKDEILEYIELLGYDSLQKLYKVFGIFDEKVNFNDDDINIYEFSITYKKELTALEELEIIEYYYDEDNDVYVYSTLSSQLEMARINNYILEELNNR